MTKTDLVNYMAEEAGLTKADAARALDAFMGGVTKGLKENGKVTLTGFFTFSAEKKAAKEGRNPRTGETVKIPARVAVKGKGVEDLHSGSKGNMYVIINVVIPSKIDKKQKKLFEELSNTDLKTSEFKEIENYLKKNK